MGSNRTDPLLNFEDYTVVWIAPLEIEAQAALYMLDNIHPGRFPSRRGDDYIYLAGDINGHNIVIATFPAGHNYGVGAAAALASQVRKSFHNIWFGLLVGVAAGLPNLSAIPPRDIRLGDVLVGVGAGDKAGLVSYGLGKETDDGFELIRHGVQAKTEAIVSSAIGTMKLLAQISGNTFLQYYEQIKDKTHSNGNFADPGQEKDQLYKTAYNENGLLSEPVVRTPRPPSARTIVWYGSIGSGDTLMRSAKKRDELRDTFDLIGLEMEAAGTIDRIPVGVIRGVCDYGDAQKNKVWQPYAAAMATAYAKALLKTITPTKNRGKEAVKAQEDVGTLQDSETQQGLSARFQSTISPFAVILTLRL
jgi:nucleoside phosphorylase